jgi:hypothetical protein
MWRGVLRREREPFGIHKNTREGKFSDLGHSVRDFFFA